MIIRKRAGALALACVMAVGVMTAAVSQTVQTPAGAGIGDAVLRAIGFGAIGQPVTPVSAANPLPTAPQNGSGASAQQVQGTAASGATAVGNPVPTAGLDGTTVRTAWADALGNLGMTLRFGANAAVIGGMSTPPGAGSNGLQVKASCNAWNGSAFVLCAGDSQGRQQVVQRAGDSIATAQVSVGTTSTQVAAARTGRQRITISIGAANSCSIGNSGVTLTTGFPLQPVAGASVTIETAAPVFAACSATTTIGVLEPY